MVFSLLIKIPLLFKEGLGVVDINPSQPPLHKGRTGEPPVAISPTLSG
jgi:hypothetical protein